MSVDRDWLAFMPLCAAVLHIGEEFVFPGGFAQWYRGYRREAKRITPRFLIIVNVALVSPCLVIIELRGTPTGVAYWLTFSALMCSNGIWHAWASYRSHSYSPGVITGVAAYGPMAIYGFAHYLRIGAASTGTAVVAALIGGSYHLWSALYHKPEAGRSVG